MNDKHLLTYQTFLTGNASPDAELPLIVPLHFMGSNPKETFNLFFQNFSYPARIIAPSGQYILEEEYSWYPDTIYGKSEEEQGKFVSKLVLCLLENVEVWKQEFPTNGKPIFLGLSQGGDMCFTLAAKHGDEFKLCMPIAGRLLINEFNLKSDSGSILVHHGNEDPIVPIATMRTAVNRLTSAGIKVDTREYEGAGHAVPEEMVETIEKDILSVIAS